MKMLNIQRKFEESYAVYLGMGWEAKGRHSECVKYH